MAISFAAASRWFQFSAKILWLASHLLFNLSTTLLDRGNPLVYGIWHTMNGQSLNLRDD